MYLIFFFLTDEKTSSHRSLVKAHRIKPLQETLAPLTLLHYLLHHVLSNAEFLTEHVLSYTNMSMSVGQINACLSKHSFKVPIVLKKDKLATTHTNTLQISGKQN